MKHVAVTPGRKPPQSFSALNPILCAMALLVGHSFERATASDNLARSGTASASSEETNKKNFARHAMDGNLDTRWCAAGPDPGAWWQVDLGKPRPITGIRLHWEQPNVSYGYHVDTSTDGSAWVRVVDQPRSGKALAAYTHEFDSTTTRHVRVTFLGSDTGAWGSLREVELYAGPIPPISDVYNPAAALLATVQAPSGFNVNLFGMPPEVNYPVCLAAAPTGEVLVGVDEQGSLGKKPGGGRVLVCKDTDGDGAADSIHVFARMDHPRGLIFDRGRLWVLHPPSLTLFEDTDGDWVADRQKTLITGISTDSVEKRGADHTTNGIRMGIDGWIYIAVGDFGFVRAEGTDGTVLNRRGGGVVRIRPDGTEMEIHAWGLRNILDVGIDPYMNLFTRDNTNDGGGWDIRLSHIIQSAHYGYPSLYMNFTEETMPPLADYGGGSGCGSMFLHDPRWPAPFGNAFYSCDWGRSAVYLHDLPAAGPTFAAHQEMFLGIPRPTDIDVDGSGRMVVSSWNNGGFSYSGPNVGFVVQLVPKGFQPIPFPVIDSMTNRGLIEMLSEPSAVHRQHAQLEILRRGADTDQSRRLERLAAEDAAPLYARVASIFTLKQLDGSASHPALLQLAGEPAVREFALRALTDRRTELNDLPLAPFVDALGDSSPRVRAQAIISLGRLGQPEIAEAILPLTLRSEPSPVVKGGSPHKQPDPGRVLPLLAVTALVDLNATDACLRALDGPYRTGALHALRGIHTAGAVNGLIQKLGQVRSDQLRNGILSALIRLYHREGEYKEGWWGTRPDTSGPYYDRQTWAQSDAIASAIGDFAANADPHSVEFVREELKRHSVAIEIEISADPGQPTVSSISKQETKVALALPKPVGAGVDLIANLGYEDVLQRAQKAKGSAEAGKPLFTTQGCVACHTWANGQAPKGPHLVDIGKRYSRVELIESIVRPNAKIAQGFDTYEFSTADGEPLLGFVVSESADTVEIRNVAGIATQLKKATIEKRTLQSQSMMPEGMAGNLTPEQLADVAAYLESLN